MIMQLKSSKHPVAKACQQSLTEKQKNLQESLRSLQKAEVEGNYKAPTMKMVTTAEALIQKVVADIKLAKSIK